MRIFNKKNILFYLGILLFIVTFIFVSKYTKKNNYYSFYINIPIKYKFNDMDGYIIKSIKNVKVTAYNNDIKQTDNTPNITASNRFVYEGSIAVSRDIYKKYVKFGDIICIKKKNNCYIVEDLMNEKFTKRIDIFTYNKLYAKTINFNSDITILKVR